MPPTTVLTVPTVPDITSDKPSTQSNEEMPREEYDLDTVTEKELEYLQEQSKKPFNPIISIEDFFSNDMPLDNHSVEESPCYPIIDIKPGEIPTEIVYYCRLHPDLSSTFLSQIEIHCRKEPGIHKSEILKIVKGEI